jgi:BMFP domain-containing protein YqiC
MNNPPDLRAFFEELQGRVSELLRNSPAKDIEQNVKAVLAQGFTKLDLATREQLELQAELLSRTRIRLEQLELRVAELETKHAGAGGGASSTATGSTGL